MQDASRIKERIMRIIEQRGPSLPVRIASEIGISPLFASAFLSELLSDKKLRLSYLRVGNSPLYFVPGQEAQLENFSEHLKSKEKEAFLLLQEKRFLDDALQEPAIRVALRAIKDFAIAFEKDEKIYWRYFIVPESELGMDSFVVKEEKSEAIGEDIRSKEDINEKKSEDNVDSEKTKSEVSVDKKIAKKKVAKKKSSKKNDKLFNQVKEFLAEKGIDIVDIEGVGQKDLILRVNDSGEEKLIVAYDKKRVGEEEIVKASKKASELGLRYIILSFGEPLKKLQNLIDAVKGLSGIEKL